jgi:hypothetical protein
MWRSTRRCPCERGCGSETGIIRRSLLRAVTGCGYDLCQAFKRARNPGERRLCQRMVLRTMRGERSRCSQLTSVQVRLRRREEDAHDAVPCGRRPDARSAGPWGERRMCRAALTVMTPTYSCAIRASTPSERPSHEPPSRKSQRRAARRRRQCPHAPPAAGSKRSEEH